MSKRETEVNRKIGKTVAKKRIAAGYTQEQAAERLGIGTEAFSRIERGLTSPGLFKLYEMAEMFGCGVESFLIEGSPRATDQVEHVRLLMSKLSPQDRQLMIEVLEKLSQRLGRKSRGDTQTTLL